MLDGEIDAATWEEMISSIRGSFKDPGQVSTRENVFEWTSQSETEKAQVTALIMDGKTKFTVFWTEPIIAIPLYVITLIGTIISLPIAFEGLELSGPVAFAFIMSVVLTLFSVSRFLVGRVMDKQVNKLQQLETTLDLIAFHRFKQRFEITFTKAFIAFAFNKLKENWADLRFSEDLQEETRFTPITCAV